MRRVQSFIYIGLWLLVVLVYILDMLRARSEGGLPLLDAPTLFHMVARLLPFIVLFAVHNYLLIPRLLLTRWKSYLALTLLAIALIWGWQTYDFLQAVSIHDPLHKLEGPPEPGIPHHPLLPVPLLLDIAYDLLIVGVNIAIALIFQNYEDRLERESLLKANAENSLSYLKAQINPHFYMNMLNNIHGQIEIDPVKAQEMLIDMSHLMRYMLYDSSRPRIALSSEISFMENYLRIMRQRYPSSRVTISSDFPPPSLLSGIEVPPLLFLVFIENAFKHGISYRVPSFVSVNLTIEGGRILFSCLNSVHADPAADNDVRDESAEPTGIGLRNVRERLRLIYGSDCHLDINRESDRYLVQLNIPCNETKNPDN